MASGIVWQSGHAPSDLGRALVKFGEKIDANTLRIATVIADEATAYMKAHHPWTNRTGAAEAGLQASAVQLAEHLIAIYLVSSAPHGIWLEIKYAGKWGIIPEAMVFAYGRLMQELRAIFAGG